MNDLAGVIFAASAEKAICFAEENTQSLGRPVFPGQWVKLIIPLTIRFAVVSAAGKEASADFASGSSRQSSNSDVNTFS
ncbi:hypothetical protein GCM10009414_05710 [Tatumella terrea]